MTSYLVIVNPVAGRGCGLERAEMLAAGLPDGSDCEIVETGERGAGTRIATERGRDVDRIIAVGGDGTLNEGLTGLMSARESEGAPQGSVADLGFLPSGTANAAARAFDFSDDPERVADSLRADTSVRAVDVGVVRHVDGERPFLIRFGAGLDAAVIETLNASRTGAMGIGGLLRNAPRIIETMGRYPAPEIEIEIEVDGAPFVTAASVVLPNVEEVGLEATVAEDADPADGLLDVLAVSLPSKLSIARLAVHMLASSLESAPGVRHTLAKRVRLRSEGDAPFQLDGEPVGVLPVEVRLEHRAVRLLLTR